MSGSSASSSSTICRNATPGYSQFSQWDLAHHAGHKFSGVPQIWGSICLGQQVPWQVLWLDARCGCGWECWMPYKALVSLHLLPFCFIYVFYLYTDAPISSKDSKLTISPILRRLWTDPPPNPDPLPCYLRAHRCPDPWVRLDNDR